MELKQSRGENLTVPGSAFNCTLWNWNTKKNGFIAPPGILLIVPYGIETHCEIYNATPIGLLIVPYGIETSDEYEAFAVVFPF